MKKTISFEIELDENHLAEKIKMSSADSDKDIDKIKSILVSMWDSNQKNSLNISLWTKDMPLNDMFIFYHQTLITMAKNLEKATDNQKKHSVTNPRLDAPPIFGWQEHTPQKEKSKQHNQIFQ